jgi:hypothetical protein
MACGLHAKSRLAREDDEATAWRADETGGGRVSRRTCSEVMVDENDGRVDGQGGKMATRSRWVWVR